MTRASSGFAGIDQPFRESQPVVRRALRQRRQHRGNTRRDFFARMIVSPAHQQKRALRRIGASAITITVGNVRSSFSRSSSKRVNLFRELPDRPRARVFGQIRRPQLEFLSRRPLTRGLRAISLTDSPSARAARSRSVQHARVDADLVDPPAETAFGAPAGADAERLFEGLSGVAERPIQSVRAAPESSRAGRRCKRESLPPCANPSTSLQCDATCCGSSTRSVSTRIASSAQLLVKLTCTRALVHWTPKPLPFGLSAMRDITLPSGTPSE